MRSASKEINMMVFDKLDQMMASVQTDDRLDKLVDIVTFVESEQFLNQKLYPWQMLMLKIFYMGTPGNENLSISFEPLEHKCGNCVWNKNRLTRFKSPCLSCIHYDVNARKEFFKKEATKSEITTGRIDQSEIDDWQRENTLRSNFLSEIQMIMWDLTPENKRCDPELAYAKAQMIRDYYNGVDLVDDFDRFLDKNDDELPEDDVDKKDSYKEKVRDQIIRKIGMSFTDLVLVLGRRSGKAVALDTPIITPTGWRTMNDLQVGDYVFGDDGLPAKVIATSEIITDEDCYEIIFSNNDKIVAGANHQWNVFDRKRQKAWMYYKKTINYNDILPENWVDWKPNIGGVNHYSEYENNLILELKKQKLSNKKIAIKLNRTKLAIEQQYTKLNKTIKNKQNNIFTTEELYNKINNNDNIIIPLHNSIIYKNNILPIDPWVLGYLCGDGDTSGGGRVACDARDRIYLLNKFSNLGYVENINYKYDDIHFYIQNITEKWKDLNLHNGKYIPNEYKQSNIENRINLLTGLIDSDGSVDNHGAYRFTNTNKQLIEDTKEICHSIGIDVSLYIRNNRKRNNNLCKTLYELIIRSFLPLTTIKRKLEKARHDWKLEQKSNKIIKITKLEHKVPIKCIQVDNQSHLYLIGKSMIPTHNSLETSLIALYESYRLIRMGNPQKVFGLLEDDLITILNVAGSEAQAEDAVFKKIKALAINSPFFKKYINTNRTGEQSMILFTPNDIEMNEKRKEEGLPLSSGSIEIKSGTSKAATQVGMTCAVIIIDEVAEMIKKEDSKMGDTELYNKLKPSLATFDKFGKICVISNPLAKEGVLWKMYNKALINKGNPLMFQLPTSLCNPSIEPEWLEEQKKDDAEIYEMQYLANFSEGASEPLFPSVLIDMAFNQRRKRAYYGVPGVNYFAHLDPAFNSDNYALAICHLEERLLPDVADCIKVVVFDQINMWCPKTTKEQVLIEEVDEYILDICKRKFNIVSLTYDQFSSISSVQKMQKNGIPCMQTAFTHAYIEKIYDTLLHLFQEDRIEIYGIGEWVPEIKDQLLFLQKKYSRRGFRVQAADGHFDDICDCIAGAAYMSLQQSVFASLPQIRAARLGIDAAERMYAFNPTRRTGKDPW